MSESSSTTSSPGLLLRRHYRDGHDVTGEHVLSDEDLSGWVGRQIRSDLELNLIDSDEALLQAGEKNVGGFATHQRIVHGRSRRVEHGAGVNDAGLGGIVGIVRLDLAESGGKDADDLAWAGWVVRSNHALRAVGAARDGLDRGECDHGTSADADRNRDTVTG